MSKIVSCTCKHKFQDKMYGKGKRVTTKSSDKGKNAVVYRCTVCGKEHPS
jgi:hypothetical protein